MKKDILIAVVKTDQDLEWLRKQHLYRIPARWAPRRKPGWIAFYEPKAALRRGRVLLTDGFEGRVRYWGRVRGWRRLPRVKILPRETAHPRAQQTYWLAKLATLERLAKPIGNRNRMRVVFGKTSLERLKTATDVKELFGIPLIEEKIEQALRRAQIPIQREHSVRVSGRRFRLDFAVFCRRGKIAIECDGLRWHSSKPHQARDRLKDACLREAGWKVVRLGEKEIMERPGECLDRVRQKARSLGGWRASF
jgi:very-short-patch-repair endonuclease